MERNERNYRGDFEDRNNRDDGFQNYRERYSNRHGNYYGMRDDDAEYRNVRGHNPDPNFGYRSGGPVAGYGASSYRGLTDSSNRDSYHYGDPNPYMGNSRNDGGGYERSRGTGWGTEDKYGTYGTSRGTNYSEGSGRYNRQDNSYQHGGQGRRYEDFNQDEKMYRGRSERGYNMLGIDAYYDRGEHRERRSDNDYRGGDQRNYYDRDYRGDDERYRGEIRNSNRGDNYATGLYASNRSYVSDNDDYSQRSSRYRRPGETSGPDYSAHHGASNYGMESPRG
ncbi:hypothetical protein [Pontibacter litorisediminis]|uniref:hypothetical protein n=1 Tax=Pontibacter litorisediminis TaxID=1846260 RepID=UPI0023EAB937|nr:hypothetical protein [Pontibacter litorisediminis]